MMGLDRDGPALAPTSGTHQGTQDREETGIDKSTHEESAEGMGNAKCFEKTPAIKEEPASSDTKTGQHVFSKPKTNPTPSMSASVIRKKVQRILDVHFDVEIGYKEQEIDKIDRALEEIDKAEDKLRSLWKYVDAHQQCIHRIPDAVSGEGASGEENQVDRERKSIVLYKPSYFPAFLPRSTGSVDGEEGDDDAEKKEKKGTLFARLPDGQFVQLECPECGRKSFNNRLGFVNHCRILHKLVYSTFDEAMRKCGKIVPEELVPEDDISRSVRPLISGPLQSIASTFERNQISASEPPNPFTAAPSDSQASLLPDHGTETGARALETSGPERREEGAKQPMLSKVSRFYVKKRVVVGNVSKYIPDHKREAADQFTHKWMIYVRAPPEDDGIGTFVRKVRFHLHPSFRPNDIIDITEPPFYLTRRGWGEFPIRVQLHFHDKKNRPVDIIHQLKLDLSCSGLQKGSDETHVDIELDREFFTQGLRAPAPKENREQSAIASVSSVPESNSNLVDNNTMDWISSLPFDEAASTLPDAAPLPLDPIPHSTGHTGLPNVSVLPSEVDQTTPPQEDASKPPANDLAAIKREKTLDDNVELQVGRAFRDDALAVNSQTNSQSSVGQKRSLDVEDDDANSTNLKKQKQRNDRPLVTKKQLKAINGIASEVGASVVPLGRVALFVAAKRFLGDLLERVTTEAKLSRDQRGDGAIITPNHIYKALCSDADVNVEKDPSEARDGMLGSMAPQDIAADAVQLAKDVLG